MWVCDRLVQWLEKYGPGLKSLNLSEVKSSRSEILRILDLDLPHLENLSLNPLFYLENQHLAQLLAKWGTKLKSLAVERNVRAGIELPNVALNCLESLDLSDCCEVTDIELNTVLQCCNHSLKSLTLSETQVAGTRTTHGVC